MSETDTNHDSIPEASFDDWKAVMCGRADEDTRNRVRKAIEDTSKPLGAFLDTIRNDDSSALGKSLKNKKCRG